MRTGLAARCCQAANLSANFTALKEVGLATNSISPTSQFLWYGASCFASETMKGEIKGHRWTFCSPGIMADRKNRNNWKLN
jgi:hypothetical protein